MQKKFGVPFSVQVRFKISANQNPQKISPKNSLPLPRNRKKNEMISLIYDVNDHVCLKSKSI